MNTSPLQFNASNRIGVVLEQPVAIPMHPAWDDDSHIEGQLSVDVYETDSDIQVVAPMAGAHTDKIEVFVHNDVLTIRGVRSCPVDIDLASSVFHSECYWGPFSRTVLLPQAVQQHQVRAEYANGVLLVSLPKTQKNSKISVTIVED